jgi:hypothetical protein
MDKVKTALATRKLKKILSLSLVAVLVGWVLFRFSVIISENERVIFNASRNAADIGTPVHVMKMLRTDGTLYEPVAVHNNRAYVSANRASKLRAGQRIGDGKITYVSAKLDYDTGMYLVRTSGVSDGLQMAEFTAHGYFVPLYAITNNSVMVMVDGVAIARDIDIARQDAETAYVSGGLHDGDIVILSTVSVGDMVRIVE